MEPYKAYFMPVAGTAGTYAVAYSPPRGDWLICRIVDQPGTHPAWLLLESAPSEGDARKLAYALYARDLAREACR